MTTSVLNSLAKIEPVAWITWAEFYYKFSHNAANQKIKGDEYEYAMQNWLLVDSQWSAELEVVYKWEDWPYKFGVDTGIDLVGKTYDGKWVAIQTKLYDPNYYIKKVDLDSFLSASSRSFKVGASRQEFTYRILISTGMLGPQARDTIKNQTKPVFTVLWDDLAASKVNWPSSVKDLFPARPEKAVLRDYQKEIVENALKGFAVADVGQLVLACGTGKTLCSLWIAEALKAKTILVVVPSLLLAKQIFREFQDNSREKLEFIAVCSDFQVTKRNDEWELAAYELGISKVTTNVEEFNKLLNTPSFKTKVIISTYQSLNVVKEAQKKNKVIFDLIIVDEAHRTAGAGAKSTFSLITNRKEILRKKTLYMTATPKIISKSVKRRAQEENFEICSMDDEEIYGKIFYKLSFADAIKKKILTPYQVLIPLVNTPKIENMIKERKFLRQEDGREVDALTLSTQIILLYAMKKYKSNKIITYHNTIEGASEFARGLKEAWKIMHPRYRPKELWADYISGSMTHKNRDLTLHTFTNNEIPSVICNSRCLIEGIDIVAVDGIAFVDPKYSLVDIVQAAGRAMRLKINKDHGFIIVPAFVDENKDIDEELNSSIYETIFKVLDALGSHDEDLKEELNETRRGLGVRRHTVSIKLPSRVTLDLAEDIPVGFIKAFKLKVLERTTDDYLVNFGKLQKFQKENNCYPVRHSKDLEEDRLAMHVINVRRDYRNKELSEEKIRLYETLPYWSWNPHDDTFFIQCKKVKEFAKNKKRLPISTADDPEEAKLGNWVRNCIQNYKNEKLTQERIDLCNSIPYWSWGYFSDKFVETVEQVKEFAYNNKRLPSSASTDKNEAFLGSWVSSRRKDYKNEKLTQERIDLCNSIPYWSWDPKDDIFYITGNEVKEFSRINGFLPYGFSEDKEEARLGRWVYHRREDYKNGKLTQERIDFCNSIPGWSWVAKSGRRKQVV